MCKRVMLRIRCDRRSDLVALLALALLIVAGLGYLAWNRDEVAASAPQAPLASSAGMRQYYLTITSHSGASADEVCAGGYHFASLWEILDPASLKYNTSLGSIQLDSGQGPPSNLVGWVRTGYNGNTSSTVGMGNCLAWLSSNSIYNGTVADLPHQWTTATNLHVWNTSSYSCNTSTRVWCVED